MHPIRRQRLIAVVFIVILATAAVGLLTYALRQNINLFYTPSQIVAGEAPEGTRIRVGGMVVAGSVTRVPDSLDTVFKVTDGAGEVAIAYTGILPDLFAENEAAVATGELRDDGTFAASEVLAKHDENYTPPEVADAMNKAMEKAREGRQ
ncbi:MAG: cytochrome c maturation protein CcmE [Porticoccaceae bacterium]|jgi:cytochrome c-type biogenesis protein CcmE|nr:cytochrome c maturation protein CcmE [Porticoccaceae bacterium]MEA3301582.1 cytochrome c maturation protein CcmE [Pseudomonadota bacterium]HLS98818.1 cytochrome c maturation protein CcmE [Porticoccaceae bacterium]